MTPPARLAAAIELLSALEATPRRPADATAHEFFRARRFIGGGDRRAVSDQVWGVVRQRLRLDWHLAQHGARPTARLLLAAYVMLAEQRPLATVEKLFTGDKYGPPSLLAFELKFLRPLEGLPLVTPTMPDFARLNLPEWALPGLLERFGEALPAEAAAMEKPAPLDLRANLLKGDRARAAGALASEGIATTDTAFSPWGLRLPGRQPVMATKAFQDGLLEVQDEGSQLIALLTDARPGMRVADICAGAGGKTLALAAAMQNRGRLTACDISATRLEGATRRLRRAGVDNAERHLFEAGDRWAKRREASFDRVLVDAPCTGTGTWRRNPDARTRTGPEDLAELLPKQADLLALGAGLVRVGGQLVYATCSLLPAENEAQVAAFLASHPGFAPVPLAEAWAATGVAAPPPGEGPCMVMSPGRHGTDGFFAAVLRRTA